MKLYIIIAWLVALVAGFNSGLIITRLIQVSNGRSVLDSEAPSGLKLRKWFLILLAFTNLVRAICTVLELFQIISSSSISYSSELWIFHCMPSFFYLATCSFFAHYIGHLHFSLQSSDGKTFRHIWAGITIFFVVAGLVCLLVLPVVSNSTWIIILRFCFLLIAVFGALQIVAVLYFVVRIWASLGASMPQRSNAHKVLARLIILVVIIVVSIGIVTTLRGLEYKYYREERAMVTGIVEWLCTLIGEGVASLLMILILTNSLHRYETTLRLPNTHTEAVAGKTVVTALPSPPALQLVNAQAGGYGSMGYSTGKSAPMTSNMNSALRSNFAYSKLPTNTTGNGDRDGLV